MKTLTLMLALVVSAAGQDATVPKCFMGNGEPCKLPLQAQAGVSPKSFANRGLLPEEFGKNDRGHYCGVKTCYVCEKGYGIVVQANDFDHPVCVAGIVVEPEPIDVPAIWQKGIVIEVTGAFLLCEEGETGCYAERVTCADKTRILMHDEQDPPKSWCHKPQP